jgi:ketosteroid isomerase-like protein
VSENLDLVKSIYAAWEKGDFSSADWADPEIDFVMVGGINTGSWKGVEEMGEAWATMLRAWDDLRAVPDEIRELDDGRILVFLRNEGRGRGSGIDVGEITVKAANVFTVRGGKVTSLTLYWDREQAIAELGLADEGGSRGG